jgi:hypothetical protein
MNHAPPAGSEDLKPYAAPQGSLAPTDRDCEEAGLEPGCSQPADVGLPAPLRWALQLAIVLACAMALSPDVADPDLWGHVRYGEDLIQTGQLPRHATYTFTSQNHRWVNHENLSEVALAVVARIGGGRGLLIMKCLLALLLGACWLRHAARRNVSLPLTAVVVLLAAMNLAYNWSLRPHLFSYVCFTLLILLLDHVFATWNAGRVDTSRDTLDPAERGPIDNSPMAGGRLNRDRFNPASFEARSVRLARLWLFVPLMMVWANTHGGFVAGYLLLAVYLLVRIVQSLWAAEPRSVKTAGYLSAVLLAAGVATLANPYGPGLHAWLIRSLGFPRPEIQEWASLTLDYDYFWLFVALVGMTLGSWCFSRRPRDPAQAALLLIMLWQSIEHVRHIPFFAIAVGFWLPTHAASALDRLSAILAKARLGTARKTPQPLSGRMTLLLGLGTMGVIALLGFRLVSRLDRIRVDRSDFPVAAFQFMEEHDLKGRLVVTYNWAQYAIAAFAPRTTVGFDGRFRTCYSQDIVDMHFDLIFGDLAGYRARGSGRPLEPRRVLEFEDPQLVLLDRRLPHSIEVMQRQKQWSLLYQDGLAQVWGRADRYDDPHGDHYLSPSLRSIGEASQQGYATWPALPQ